MTATAPLAFAAGAGVATFLSPCALPLVPGYVGYYVSAAGSTRQRAAGIVVRGLAAGAGALVTLGVLAGLAVAVGRPVTERLTLIEPVVGIALLGLGIAAVAGWSPARTVSLPERRTGTGGFALFGAGYAGASAGCVLPVFLAVVVNALTLPPATAATVVGVYAAGVALPLLGVTLAVGAGVDVAADQLAGHGSLLERLAGVVLALAGVGQLVVATMPSAVPASL